MHGSDWLAILRKIPPELHDCLSVTMINGTELIVQQVYRLDREFMVMRSRLSGTTDGTRLTLVPYGQINFLAFLRAIPEADIGALFGRGIATAAPAPVVRVIEETAPAAAEESQESGPMEFELPPTVAAPEMPGQPAATPPPPASVKPGQLSKSILLARLRERLGQKTQ